MIATLLTTAIPFPSKASGQDLPNGGFEEFSVSPNSYNTIRELDDWQTDLSSGMLKIWGSGFQQINSFEGIGFAQLGGNISSNLFQDLSNINYGQEISWYFAHRARIDDETVNLKITDFGTDNQIGNNDDTVLFNQNFTTSNEWNLYQGKGIYSLGNKTRIEFTPILNGQLNNSTGNFIDYVNFGTNIAPPIPGPGVLSFLLIAGVLFKPHRR
jgi:hypothetical protein